MIDGKKLPAIEVVVIPGYLSNSSYLQLNWTYVNLAEVRQENGRSLQKTQEIPTDG
jgi:hypothetical protein